MIHFKRVVVRNFLSVGDNPLTLELDRHPTTLITGSNGSGKSVLVSDSLTFALFGKSYRGINKPALINTLNRRDSVVEIVFEKGQDVFTIIRGQKPNRLEIYKNGSALNEEAAIKDTQAYIEHDILGFDYNSFIRVCVMSTMNYTPFMQLSANDRRNLVENMLSLKSFSEMNRLHKSNIGVLKELIVSLHGDISVQKAKYDEKNRTYNLLQQIDADHVNSIKANIRSLGEKLDFSEKACANLQLLIDDFDIEALNRELIDCKSEMNSVRLSIRSSEVEKTHLEKKVTYFTDHSDCDKCHQKIDPRLAKENVKRYTGEIEVCEQELDAYHEKLSQLGLHIEVINGKLASAKELETELVFSKRSSSVIAGDIRKKLAELEQPHTSTGESGKIKTETDELKARIKYLARKYETACKDREIGNIATDLLKDTGIKSKIIKQYVPLLVGYVNHYLEQLNISIKFSMDENFNESITTRYANEYQYQNLSMGERARLDLAMAFAWRQIAKLKGSVYCNILILDEVLDASLDLNGTEDALGILEEVCADTSVFIISHKNNLDEKVRSVIRLEKQNGFTKIL